MPVSIISDDDVLFWSSRIMSQYNSSACHTFYYSYNQWLRINTFLHGRNSKINYLLNFRVNTIEIKLYVAERNWC